MRCGCAKPTLLAGTATFYVTGALGPPPAERKAA